MFSKIYYLEDSEYYETVYLPIEAINLDLTEVREKGKAEKMIIDPQKNKIFILLSKEENKKFNFEFKNPTFTYESGSGDEIVEEKIILEDATYHIYSDHYCVQVDAYDNKQKKSFYFSSDGTHWKNQSEIP